MYFFLIYDKNNTSNHWGKIVLNYIYKKKDKKKIKRKEIRQKWPPSIPKLDLGETALISVRGHVAMQSDLVFHSLKLTHNYNC